MPAPNKEDDDHNPPRIAARNLFDLAVGDDNIFHGDRLKWSAQITVISLAFEYVLYNFLSTFSGTHYVTPRSITGQIGFHFSNAAYVFARGRRPPLRGRLTAKPANRS